MRNPLPSRDLRRSAGIDSKKGSRKGSWRAVCRTPRQGWGMAEGDLRGGRRAGPRLVRGGADERSFNLAREREESDEGGLTGRLVLSGDELVGEGEVGLRPGAADVVGEGRLAEAGSLGEANVAGDSGAQRLAGEIG